MGALRNNRCPLFCAMQATHVAKARAAEAAAARQARAAERAQQAAAAAAEMAARVAQGLPAMEPKGHTSSLARAGLVCSCGNDVSKRCGTRQCGKCCGGCAFHKQ